MGVHLPQHVRAHAAPDADKLGFTQSFTIYDTDDLKRLYKEIMAELDIDPKRYPVNSLMNRISQGEKRADRPA